MKKRETLIVIGEDRVLGTLRQDVILEYTKSKINLNLHPLARERNSLKESYVFLAINYLNKYKTAEELRDLTDLYVNTFLLEEKSVFNNKDLDQAIETVSKTYTRLRKKVRQKKNYKHLFLAELMFLTNQASWTLEDDFLQRIIKKSKISSRTVMLLTQLFDCFYCNDFLQAAEIIANNRKLKYCQYFLDFFQDQYRFEQQDAQSVAVIATMSAGKSTFLNAIIGQKIFPSENKACTAKIFEFTSNKDLHRFTGLIEGNQTLVKWNVTPDCMKEWNKDSSITFIHTEGRLADYSMINDKITFLDTPGPNNSRNEEHHLTTTSFLKSGKYTKVAYILNATNLAIDDDEELLKTVLRHVPTEKIVFYLNKIDALDIEGGEGITETVNEARSYLQDHHIKNPVIIPISSYAASLFKTVLLGNSDTLTRKQVNDFHRLYELFQDSRYDIHQYVTLPKKLPTSPHDRRIQVGGVVYQRKEIYACLVKTGIYHAEKTLTQ